MCEIENGAHYSSYTEIRSYPIDPELENKVKRTGERISENLHICANEPSLALYRLSEHVRKALPPTVESRSGVRRLHQQLQGAYFDADYGLETVRGMDRASIHIARTQELLKNAIFLQQQIKYEQTRRSRNREPSMYQRFSAHLTSVDLSDLKETARETANRVENALQRTSSGGSSDNGSSKLNFSPSSSVQEQEK